MLISNIILRNETSPALTSLGSFLAENIYLMIGLIIGVVVSILMRKNIKIKP